MPNGAPTFSPPRWRLTRWLADAGQDVPNDVGRALIASLFGTLPIFLGGVVNSVVVAGVIALRSPTAPFLVWLGLELALAVIRLWILTSAHRAAKAGPATPTDIYIVLAVCWAASVGYGTFVSLISGDWVAATLACLSAAAMVGGICFRNFGAPRLAATMIVASLGPCCLAAPFAGEPALYVAFLQIPFYLFSMTVAAFRLNRLLVTTMKAERENEHRARHDSLTGLTNRTGLESALESGPPHDDRANALLYLDLDGFKVVNDTHGHAAGDHLLKMAAERLRGVLRSGDIAARIGGDEFVIVARNVDPEQVEGFGERLIRELGEPYELAAGVVATVGVSVGVALTPLHGEELPDLLGAADRALYEAKIQDKSRCVVASRPGAPARPA